MHRPRRLAAALAVAALALTACASNGRTTGSAAGAAPAPQEPLPTSVPAGTDLRIGDQNAQLEVLLKASGQDQGTAYKLGYSAFQGGPAILEAFRAGSLDLGIVAETPAIFAQAAQQDVKVVGVAQTSRSAVHLVTSPGNPARTVAELRGKKIAYTEGTTFQPAVLNALKRAGLKTTDVTLVNLQVLDIPAALQSGQIDAAALTEPLASKYLLPNAEKGAHEITDDKDLTSGLLLLITPGKTLKDPARTAALADLTARWTKALTWQNANEAEWVEQYYVKRQNIPAATGSQIFRNTGTAAFPSYEQALTDHQAIADLLTTAGALPGKLDVSGEFDRRFEAVQRRALAG
ncbi:ABC transporter substrate-binding protein [Streptomyces sp. BE20]|uniref:ABC transporter substrate-binding protein n=1 Tax=Streptomyces sp. BE20 TaxID=3002525 RepID=UPI002E76C223|nr:ABC transporter substrate-binding protein [Streptomyces sp. BE20]MEE1825028.1 ABC transporter substrate-binding protein [Streptomyces sp. BE20]